MVSAGAAADLGITPAVAQLDRRAVAAVEAAFPKPDFAQTYQKVLAAIVERKPETAYGTFLSDIGERYVQGFRTPNFCDLMGAFGQPAHEAVERNQGSGEEER